MINKFLSTETRNWGENSEEKRKRGRILKCCVWVMDTVFVFKLIDLHFVYFWTMKIIVIKKNIKKAIFNWRFLRV